MKVDKIVSFKNILYNTSSEINKTVKREDNSPVSSTPED